ncbi:MAG: hypothetical protein V1660_04675 [archaeon]
MLKVCLVIDVERFISFKQNNPEWNVLQNLKKILAYLLRGFLYDQRGYENTYKIICKHRFPVSFMLVGSLFKPLEKKNFIDYGYHTYSHKPLTYLPDKKILGEIKNIYNAVSFSAPMNLIDDPLKPDRILKMLKKEGYKIIIWGGSTIRNKKNKIVVVPSRKNIVEPKTVEGIKCVYISNLFNDKTPKENIIKMLEEIEQNSGKESVYCITTHEFSHKDTSNLEYIIKRLIELKDQGRIKIVNLRDIAK